MSCIFEIFTFVFSHEDAENKQLDPHNLVIKTYYYKYTNPNAILNFELAIEKLVNENKDEIIDWIFLMDLHESYLDSAKIKRLSSIFINIPPNDDYNFNSKYEKNKKHIIEIIKDYINHDPSNFRYEYEVAAC